MEAAQEQLTLAVEFILQKGLFPLVLGGGHELALGHYRGIKNFLQTKDKNATPAIINFDAHLDLRPYNKQASSGTMFAQIADECTTKNQNFKYLCLGAQTYANTLSLFRKADSLGAQYILAKDMIEPNYSHISQQIKQFSAKETHVYLTICSDVFNAANAPGVSAMQPFGMQPETLLYS